MKRISRFISVLLVMFSLMAIGIVPTLAYNDNYRNSNQFYYSNKGFYNSGAAFYQYNNRFQFHGIPSAPVVIPPSTVQSPASPRPVMPSTPASNGLAPEESKMVNLVNLERAKQGVTPLGVNMILVSLARKKSQDMVDRNYFSHTSPTYGSPFDMMKNAGVSYQTAGENIAGAANTESAHQNLMNSQGHRANILNPAFNQIGIGIASGSIYGKIFTQMFIGK